MKNNQPMAPAGLTPQEGSGLLDIRSMARSLQESQDKKKEVDLGVLPADFGPSAFGNNVGLPLTIKRRSNTGKIIAVFAGSLLGVVVLLLGVLFALGVFEKKTPPPQQVVMMIPASQPEPVSAPVVATTDDTEEPEEVKGTKTTKTTKGTKTTKTTKGTKATDTKATDTKTTVTPTKSTKKDHSKEADALLDILK